MGNFGIFAIFCEIHGKFLRCVHIVGLNICDNILSHRLIFFLFRLLHSYNVLSNDSAVLSMPRRDPKMIKPVLSLASSFRACILKCIRKVRGRGAVASYLKSFSKI